MNVARRDHVKAVWLAGAGTVLVLGYAALALVQILVLNPLAAAPGIPLEQIYADIAAAGESFPPWFAFVLMGIGPVVALFLLVVAVRRDDITAVAVAVSYLTLLLLGPFPYFVASFGPRMSLADTYLISGAPYAHWYLLLYATSAAAMIALVGVGVSAAVTGRRRRPYPVG